MAENDSEEKCRIRDVALRLYKSGMHSDIVFLVGPDRHKVYAHKLILQARSEVFDTMFKNTWDSNDVDEHARSIFPLPHYTVSGFKSFLILLYADEISAPLSLEIKLEILQLSHYFRVQHIFDQSVAMLRMKLRVDNSILIYKGTKLFAEDLSDRAFGIIKRNISKLAMKSEFLLLEKKDLEKLLSLDEIEIEEIDLFNALRRWREEIDEETGESREEQMKSLFPLIRFPLMGLHIFSTQIVPLKLLSDEHCQEIYNSINGSLDELKRMKTIIQTDKKAKQFAIKCFKTRMKFPQHFIYENLGNRRGTLLPQLKFRSDQNLLIRGVKMYGPSRKLFHFEAWNFTIEISENCTPSDQKYFTYPFDLSSPSLIKNCWREEAEDFEIVFHEPLQIKKNKCYWLHASLSIDECEVLRWTQEYWNFCRKGAILGVTDESTSQRFKFESVEIEMKHLMVCSKRTEFNSKNWHSVGIIHSILLQLPQVENSILSKVWNMTCGQAFYDSCLRRTWDKFKNGQFCQCKPDPGYRFDVHMSLFAFNVNRCTLCTLLFNDPYRDS